MKVVLTKNGSDFRKEVSFDSKDFINFNTKTYHVNNADFANLKEFSSDLNTVMEVYKLNDEGEDFIICEIDIFLKLLSNFVNINRDMFIHKGLIDTFPFLKELGLYEIMMDTYNTNKPQSITLQTYITQDMIQVMRMTFLRLGDYIVILYKDPDNPVYLQVKDKDLLNSQKQGTLIIQNDKIVYANEEYAETLGLKPEDLIGEKIDYHYEKFDPIDLTYGDNLELLLKRLNNREIDSVEGFLKFDYNNKSYWDRIFAFPTFFNGENAILFSSYDSSEEKREEERFIGLKKDLDKVLRLSGYALATYDLKNGLVWSPEIYDILEADPSDNDGTNRFLRNFMVKEDEVKVRNLINNVRETHANVSSTVKVITKKGNLKYLSMFITLNFNQGKLFNYAVFVQDITYLMDDELRLSDTNRKLQQSLNERELLLKEVHHRVKNNLQIILSLLTLDSRFNTDPATTLESTKNRISSMALIHEMVYQSTDLAHVNMKKYIISEVKSLFAGNRASNINIEYDLLNLEVKMDIAIPLGIIINELVNNVIRYGFPNNEEGNLFISLSKEEEIGRIVVGDDGVDFPKDIDIHNSGSLGLTVVNILAAQIDGEFNKLDKSGAFFEVKFPFNEKL